MSSGRNYLRQVQTFSRVYLDLFRLTVHEVSLKHILSVVLLDLVGVMAYISVIGLVAQFVSITRSGADGVLGGMLPDSTLVALIFVAVAVLGLLMVATAATYGAARRMRAIARKVHVRLVSKGIVALGRVQLLPSDELLPDPSQLQKYLVRDPIQAGIAVDIILGLFQPTTHVLGATAIILYLEPLISLGLLAGGLLFLPVVFLVSRGTLQNAQQFYQNRTRQMAQIVQGVIGRFDWTTFRAPSEEDAWEMISGKDYQGYLDGFDTNRLASQRMTLVTSAFRALAISIGLLVFGWLALEGNRSWGSLIGFIGGLLFFMSGAQGFMARFATLNRLYPQVRGLFFFLQAVKDAEPRLPRRIESPEAIRLQVKPALPEAGGDVELHKGVTVLLVTSKKLRRHSLRGLIEPFLRHTAGPEGLWRLAGLAAKPLEPDRAGTIAEAVLGPKRSEETIAALEAFLRGVKAWDGIEAAGGRLEEPFEPGKLDRDAVVALNAAAVVIPRPPQTLFIAHSLLNGASAELLQVLLAHPLADYCFVVATPSTSPRSLPAGMPVVVEEGGRFIGTGNVEWWRRVMERYASSTVPDEGEMTDADEVMFM